MVDLYKNNIYNRLRKSIQEKIETWNQDLRDEDLLDLPQYDIPDYLELGEPFKLYRYMRANYNAIRGIETGFIHLSKNQDLNDIYEGVPVSSDIPQQENKILQMSDLAMMTCFTESPSNILMWSHYADSSKGICVEYDLQRLKEDPCDVSKHLLPVVYSKKRLFSRDISDLMKRYTEYTDSIKNGVTYDEKYPCDNILPQFVVKGKDWEYEKEWRIIFTKPQLHMLKNDQLNFGNVPFNCISAVYFGIRTPENIKKHILEICERSTNNGNPISVYQMHMTDKKYKFGHQKIYPKNKR